MTYDLIQSILNIALAYSAFQSH